MPGYLLEKTGKREKEGSHTMLMCHELNDFHKSDSQMGAAHPSNHPHSSSLSSGSHLQAESGPEARRSDPLSSLGLLWDSGK